MIEMSLFGSYQIRLNGESAARPFPTVKIQALAAYLAVESDQPHRREVLAGLFWPEQPEEAARVSLRQAIFQLRQIFPGSYLLTTRNEVQFSPSGDFRVDAQEFEGLIAECRGHAHSNLSTCGPCLARLEQATALYRGDFLAQFYLADCQAFEEWALLKREWFRREALQALAALSDHALQSGDGETAYRYAWRQVELDSLREEAHRQLMHALALQGRRSEALAQYETCRQLLWEELGIDPSATTKSLSEQIRSGELVRSRPAPGSIRGYQLEQQIGSGSYGAVYRAAQPAMGREVAIKIIRPRYANEPGFIRRFEVEAQVAARLEHPHIVPLYDYWREPDGAYLVMRMLKGGSLEALLRLGPVEAPRALELLGQIAAALGLAHQRGVVHQDLKPANILLDEEGNAYLTDFGIARVLGGDGWQVQGGEMIGSPLYMSPEQIRNQPVSAQTDLYSLGLVLFEMLAGTRPFAEGSLEELIDRHLHQSLPSIRDQRPDLSEAVDAVIQRATAKYPGDRFPDAPALAAAFRRALSRQPAPAGTGAISQDEPLPAISNPYKSLFAFQEADAPDFFGRETLVERLVSRLEGAPSAPRFLAVVGPSGSGKSSLVKAGLIPALRRGTIAGSEKWFIVEMIPGSRPFEELEVSLMRIAANPAINLRDALRRNASGLVQAARLALPAADGELLLVIDQFEELFTLVEDKSEVDRFLEGLFIAVTDPDSPVRALITLRADFYDRPLLHPGLSGLLQDRTEVVVPLSVEELQRAIRSPAERMGVVMEPGLETAIVADVMEQPGALPLLQYALTELFERREERLLTNAGYAATGGVLGALSRRAEEVYQGLETGGQAAARQAVLRLVTLGEGVEDTRRRVLVSELQSLFQEPPTPAPDPLEGKRDGGIGEVGDVKEVLSAFGQARLLSFDRDPATRSPTVEVAHEALLREWQRLRGWLDESRADVRLQRQLAAAAGEWQSEELDASFLFTGARLEQFEGWATGSSIALTQEERAFLEASIAERDRRAGEEAERQRRELQAAQRLAESEARRADEQARAARGLRRLAAGLVLFLLAAVGAALLAFNQQRIAQANFVTAERVRLASQAQIALDNGEGGDLPALLALRSLQYGYSPEADAALLNALRRGFTRQRYLGHTDLVWAVDFSPDGRRMVTAGNDGTGRLWDIATGQELRRFTPPVRILNMAEFSPDGRYVLFGSPGSAGARFWDTQTGQEVRQFDGHIGGAWGVDFSSDGQYALTSDDRMARLWDVQTGRELRRFAGHTDQVTMVTFSPDERLIATSSADGTARLWDVATGEELGQFSHNNSVVGVVFSPDGKSLLTASGNIAQLWDIQGDQEIRRFVGHTDFVLWGDFSPDGRYVLTGSRDKTARLWDIATGRELRQFIGHTGGLFMVAFSPDGQFVLTAGEDRTARLWELWPATEPHRISSISTLEGALAVAAHTPLSPDGRYVTNGFDEEGKALAVLNTQTGERRFIELETTADLYTISVWAFSPDNRYLLGGGSDGIVWLWDAQTGEAIHQLPGHSAPVRAAVFSPDGRALLTGSDDGTARLWDAKTGRELQQLAGHRGPVRAVAFSPDGQRVVTGGEDQTARLWEAGSGKELRQLSGHSGPAASVAFSPDGQLILTGSDDQTSRLWEAATGKEVRRFIGHTAQVSQVVFSPDGQLVLTGSDDQTVRLWETGNGTEVRRFVGHLTPSPYVGFFHDGRSIITGDSQYVYTWRTALEEVIDFACAHLTRDLTAEERDLYNIADDASTCVEDRP